MHDAPFVSGVKGFSDLLDDVGGTMGLHGSACPDELREGPPLEHLHHQIGHAAFRDVEVHHLHDVRMPQSRGDLRLLAKSRQRLRVPDEAAVQYLDREGSRQARVRGQVHLTATAFGERPDDPIGLLQYRPG